MRQLEEPIVGHLLAKAWSEKPDKPTALGTPLRYSSALGCARQMGYNAIGAEKTNPMGIADAWAPGIGTLLHEAEQAEIARVFPNAEFEVVSHIGEHISGSCDSLIPTEDIWRGLGVRLDGTHILWEYKTMGEYAFDKQVGYNRRYAKTTGASGPKTEAITQAGLNAVGIMENDPTILIEHLLLTSVTLAQVAVVRARGMGLSDWARFGAEWIIDSVEWMPLVEGEKNRMMGIGGELKEGFLGDRTAGVWNNQYLNPRGNVDWQCDYCSFRERCISDGEGRVTL